MRSASTSVPRCDCSGGAEGGLAAGLGVLLKQLVRRVAAEPLSSILGIDGGETLWDSLVRCRRESYSGTRWAVRVEL